MKQWSLAMCVALAACGSPVVDTDLIQIPATGATGTSVNSKADAACMSPAEAVFQYDTVVEGAVIVHEFRFKNTGTAPLLIADVSSGCGCTVPQNWPKELIAPGEEGSISVTFNTRGWSGDVDKRVTAVTNGEPSVVHFVLNGHILAPEGEAEPSSLPFTRH